MPARRERCRADSHSRTFPNCESILWKGSKLYPRYTEEFLRSLQESTAVLMSGASGFIYCKAEDQNLQYPDIPQTVHCRCTGLTGRYFQQRQRACCKIWGMHRLDKIELAKIHPPDFPSSVPPPLLHPPGFPYFVLLPWQPDLPAFKPFTMPSGKVL